MGPSMSFTIPVIASVLTSEMQHTSPSLSQLTTASLSPALIFALSLISLGSTIWPRSSTLTNESTLQQFVSHAAGIQQDLLLFPAIFTSSYLTILTIMIFQHLLKIIQGLLQVVNIS